MSMDHDCLCEDGEPAPALEWTEALERVQGARSALLVAAAEEIDDFLRATVGRLSRSLVEEGLCPSEDVGILQLAAYHDLVTDALSDALSWCMENPV